MKENKKTLKIKERGITLIALVITIIVLLILAGVSIAMLTGENGILTQAQRAKEETEQAEKNEMADLENMESLINEYQNNIAIPQVTDENPGQLEQEETDTFVINSIEDLVFFSADVSNGNTYEGKTVKLGVNLDFNSNKSYVNPNRTDFDKYGYNGPLKQVLTSGEGFNPIGEASTDVDQGTNYFYGVFEGEHKVISSLYINKTSDENLYIGLFSNNYGEIKNLGVIDVDLIVQGASTSVGGITGYNYNTLYNCYVTGNIEVRGNHWLSIGGLCGVTRNRIENCYNLANINCENIKEDFGSSSIACGGIAGQVGTGGCEINKCFNKGNITANGGENYTIIGGICGGFYLGNDKKIQNSYNKGRIESNSNRLVQIGGVLGVLGGTNAEKLNMYNCYNSGEVVANTEKGRISGIVGIMYNNTGINNVFNTGKITLENGKYESTSYGAGGILGVTENEANNIKINYAYNTGTIELKSTTNQGIGSIVGNRKSETILSNCYYLTGTHDVSVGYGDTTGITEWNSMDKFPSVLDVVNGEEAFKEDTNNVNNGYPILEWQ